MNEISCPLCNHKKLSDSWLKILFEGIEFAYLECLRCHSLICNPMPNEDTLLKMYSSKYFDFGEDVKEDNSIEKFREVLIFLETVEKGTFIDYGCGEGKLLKEVAKLGWNVLGIDFNPDLAIDLYGTDIKVTSPSDNISEKADVLHLGDVLEHLTDLDNQMPEILTLLKSGGYLVAHGPLEANDNLFNWMLKLNKKIQRNRVTNMAPYHVILATSQGQNELFTRFSLNEISFQVKEVAFPAPDNLSLKHLSNLRVVSLFFIRKVSQAISFFNMQNSGNRYFYLGRKS